MSLKEKEARVKLKFSEEKVNIFYSKDVAEAVNEFKAILDADLRFVTKDNYLEHIKSVKKAYKKIFGTFDEVEE
jgi:hypothetical protein